MEKPQSVEQKNKLGFKEIMTLANVFLLVVLPALANASYQPKKLCSIHQFKTEIRKKVTEAIYLEDRPVFGQTELDVPLCSDFEQKNIQELKLLLTQYFQDISPEDGLFEKVYSEKKVFLEDLVNAFGLNFDLEGLSVAVSMKIAKALIEIAPNQILEVLHFEYQQRIKVSLEPEAEIARLELLFLHELEEMRIRSVDFLTKMYLLQKLLQD